MRHWMSLREVAGSAWKKLKIMQNWDEEVGVMCLDTSLYEWRNGAQLGNREVCSQSLYGGKKPHMSTTLIVCPCQPKRFTEWTVTFLCTISFSCVHSPVTTYHTAGSLPPQRHIFNGQNDANVPECSLSCRMFWAVEMLPWRPELFYVLLIWRL